MDILKKLNENNFGEVAKLIENNTLPEQLMTGNLKSQLKRYKLSYSTPSSIQLAYKHQKAVKFGFTPALRGRQNQLCGCCNLRVQNEEIPICQNVQPKQNKENGFINQISQYKLTTDVALFLTFIKSLFYLTLLNSMIHSIFNLVTSNLFGKYCDQLESCQKKFWNKLSISNQTGNQNWIMIVDILNLASIVITILFFLLNRRRQYKLSAAIDRQTQTQADYTLLISNIPILQFPKRNQQGKKGSKLQFFYRKHIQDYFNGVISKWLNSKDQWQKNKDKLGIQLLQLMKSNDNNLRSDDIVKSVSLCYNLSRLQILQQIKANLINNFENQGDEGTSLLLNEQGQSQYSQRFSSIPEQVAFLNDCQLILNGQYARDNSFLFSVTHFAGHAFISFQYQHYKQYIEHIYKQNNKILNYNGNILKIEQASHPTDIYWQNVKVTQKQRSKRIISSKLILVLVLLFAFIVILFLNLCKQMYSNGEQADIFNIARSYTFNIIISLTIMIINHGLSYLSKILTLSERRKTKTDVQFSLLVKSFVTQLINTILLYFIIAFQFKSQQQSHFMGTNGLVSQITSLIIVTGVINLIKSIIYPAQIYGRLKRWWKYRKNENNVQNKFQTTLNKQFQFPQFSFSQRYSHYLVTLYTACFYSYIVPIGIPAVCILFFFQYWIDKYTLLRRSSLKYHYSFTLSQHVSKIFETSLLALGLGNFIFSSYIHGYKINVYSAIGFGIAALFVILVWITPQNIQNIVFGSYEYNQKYIYDDCIQDGKFSATYWTQNPATFLIEQQKITGRRKVNNPAFNRQSKQGEVFLSSFNN